MSHVELIATATFGLEAIVAREVKALGYQDVRVETGKVTFTADETAICRCNLWLRSADRVLVKMGSFKALTFDELYEGTRALDWPAWLPENAHFPVEGKAVQSKLFSVPSCQGIAKKAIVEKMKQRYRKQWFDENGPRYTVEVALLKDEATLTIDTSGAGLHKRGYRQLSAPAPLKETLAAAMLNLSVWNAERPLIDPFCGSGTIPIEAALIGLNMAPGLNRSFVSEDWPRIPRGLWKRIRQEAAGAVTDKPLQIMGTDIDDEVLRMARYHAKLAGLEGRIHFQQVPAVELRSSKKYGVIVCNPPYGERLGEQREAEQVYRDLKHALKGLETWSVYVLTSHPGFERILGRHPDRRRKLYNGRLECQYYQYLGPRPPLARPEAQTEDPGTDE